MSEIRMYPEGRRAYYPALDGLRAIAVLLVVGFHAAVPGDLAFRRGSYGVQIFFAISGILITTLLLDERRRTGRIDLKAFYRRRTARIFPLYYLVLGLYCLLVWATQHGPDAEAFWKNLPAFATYTANWAVDHRADGGRVIFLFAWSLAVEEQFYLVWPSALVWLKRWAPIALLGAVVLHPYYFAAIALGCFVALGLDHPRSRTLLLRCATPGLAAIAVVIVLAIPINNVWLEASVAVWLVLSLVLKQKHPLTRALSWQPLRWIGGVSYGIYMLHQLALNAARKGHVHGYPLVIVGAGVATLAAAVSYYVFERRITRWARGADTLRAVSAPMPAGVAQETQGDARPAA